MIYLIVDENKNFCKIGFTEKEIESRLSMLQTGNPLKLFILSLIDGTSTTEREFHNRFRNLHKRGEWFLFMPEILTYFLEFPQLEIPTLTTRFKIKDVKKSKDCVDKVYETLVKILETEDKQSKIVKMLMEQTGASQPKISRKINDYIDKGLLIREGTNKNETLTLS